MTVNKSHPFQVLSLPNCCCWQREVFGDVPSSLTVNKSLFSPSAVLEAAPWVLLLAGELENPIAPLNTRNGAGWLGGYRYSYLRTRHVWGSHGHIPLNGGTNLPSSQTSARSDGTFSGMSVWKEIIRETESKPLQCLLDECIALPPISLSSAYTAALKCSAQNTWRYKSRKQLPHFKKIKGWLEEARMLSTAFTCHTATITTYSAPCVLLVPPPDPTSASLRPCKARDRAVTPISLKGNLGISQ